MPERVGRRRLLTLAALVLPMTVGPLAAAASPSAETAVPVETAVPAPSVLAEGGEAAINGTVPGVFAEAAPSEAEPAPKSDLAPGAASALLMDASSGQVLWAKNPNARRPAASVTKLMTMAVVLDAITSGRIHWDDRVTASETAVRTGGAQIWLKLGEVMTVRELFYAVAVQSANDAAVALAEYVGGSVEGFVQLMNRKAQALGMRDTVYSDANGLDDTNQYTSAYDIALLSRYLVADQPQVLKYTSTWEYWLRQNKLWMVNRNKLLARIPGTDGLKTGFTSRAGYCLSATARRGATRLISVVLGEPSGPTRFSESGNLLQWGFSNYATVEVARAGDVVATVPVEGATVRSVALVPRQAFGVTVPRGREKAVRTSVTHPHLLQAPVRAHQAVGEISVSIDGRAVAAVPLVAASAAPRVSPFGLWLRIWAGLWPWLHA